MGEGASALAIVTPAPAFSHSPTLPLTLLPPQANHALENWQNSQR